jgi:hypothetical protein
MEYEERREEQGKIIRKKVRRKKRTQTNRTDNP